MDIDATAAHQPLDNDATAPSPVGRRLLLGAGLGGAAISLLPAFAARAGATTPPTDPPTSDPGTTVPAATTTTAPPQQPTVADTALLAFAEGLEIAIRDLYDIALDGTEFDELQLVVVATLREAHEAYYQSLSALLGQNGSATPNAEMLTAFEAGLAGEATDVLAALYDIESTAVATHTDILGQLQGTDGAKLLASIFIVEARHGTVLADLGGKTSLDDLLVATEADALAPAEG